MQKFPLLFILTIFRMEIGYKVRTRMKNTFLFAIAKWRMWRLSNMFYDRQFAVYWVVRLCLRAWSCIKWQTHHTPHHQRSKPDRQVTGKSSQSTAGTMDFLQEIANYSLITLSVRRTCTHAADICTLYIQTTTTFVHEKLSFWQLWMSWEGLRPQRTKEYLTSTW